MANLIVLQQDSEHVSPFDAIRRFDENGNEFWTSRELMPLLGYRDYKRMKDVLSRARFACQNTGNPVAEHFREVPLEGNTTGRPGTDHELSGLATLLTILEGDIRKPEIQSAKAFFIKKLAGNQHLLGELLQAISEFEVPEDLIEDQDLYVYAIQNTETKSIKIGISRNPGKRLKTLQTGSDAPLILLAQKAATNGFADEKTLHKKLDEHHRHGEWFNSDAIESIYSSINTSAQPG